MQFGIVGYGRFGKLWADALAKFGDVLVYEKNPPPSLENSSIKMAELANVAQADMVFLLTPISEFEHTCEQIKPLLNAHSIVIDCCSVKVHPVKIMQQVFAPTQPLIATHPLFGPDSVKKTAGLSEHKIVLCPVRCTQEQQQQLEQLLKAMGLQVYITTPENHDKQMANSQGLVHFIGRGLAALDLQPQEIATPDFQALLNINTMVVNDTWRLFLDMHQYNPYTKQIRKKFIHQLVKLEQAIDDGNT